ncbi:MAG: TAXI family TRAP transporter solute-binding subunit [Vicinamibacteraceae bacterium]|nr:TAXI family TRAP transporter solute-binding subunit [Vicinamibacteraceae bacterium]
MRWLRVLACTLLLAPAGWACGGAQAHRVQRVNLITGSTGSSWYSIGSAIAERTNALLPGYPVTAVPGAGGVSNPARVARMPGDLGLSFSPFLRAAYRGEPPYPQAYPELRHVATLIENRFHLLMAEGLGSRELGDVLARRAAVRMSTGPPGSGEEFLLRETLAYFGVSYDDIRAWGGRVDLLGTGERADSWRDRHADIVTFSINEPAPVVSELLTTRAGHLWSLPKGAIDHLVARWGIRPAVIDEGVYPQQGETATVGVPFVVFTTEDVDAEIVYAMTRAIAESREYLETVHAGFRRWTPEMMAEHDELPLHSGAARYYRERGWLP